MTDRPRGKEYNRDLVAEFRAHGGKVTGYFADAPLLVLTTTGLKSGEPRTVPLVYTTDADRLVIIASYGGRPENPAWYHNLVANPIARVELPGEQFEVRARLAEGEERDRLYAAQVAVRPAFAGYEQRTTRTIPVFILERMPNERFVPS